MPKTCTSGQLMEAGANMAIREIKRSDFGKATRILRMLETIRRADDMSYTLQIMLEEHDVPIRD